MSERVTTAMTALGRRVLSIFSACLDLWGIFLGTLVGLLRRGRPAGEIAYQMYVIGNKSVLFVAVTLGFIGMVMIYQSCLQVSRITGDLSQVGGEFAKLLTYDFAPTLTSLMLATRVGAGIAAEIGSMKVTEQIDALRMCGVRPIDYLIVPRFVAALVMTVVLSIWGAVFSFAAGALTAWSSFEVNPRVFFNLDAINYTHLTLGLIKAVTYGMAIPVISGFCGLRARGSSEGVGWATTAAVIGSSFAVIALDFIISAAAYITVGASL
ncbi:MAG: ABC transporter permease [Proteobacteria bacterium]|nr:ABC transporter permease [Pseudomonadota bacterium]